MGGASLDLVDHKLAARVGRSGRGAHAAEEESWDKGVNGNERLGAGVLLLWQSLDQAEDFLKRHGAV
jgi:hypothetical protein